MIDTIPSDHVFTISEQRIVQQIGTVLRIQHREEIILFINGGDDIVCRVLSTTPKEIKLEKTRTIPAQSSGRTVIAAISIVKGDLFELIVQKLTEIGVHTIVPIISDRTVKRAIRLDRLQIISDEALELCGGNIRVTISEPISLSVCMEKYPLQTLVFEQYSDKEVSNVLLGEKVIFCIGPEGGWSEEEKKLFEEKNVTFVSLGDRTFRAETAATVVAYELVWNS